MSHYFIGTNQGSNTPIDEEELYSRISRRWSASELSWIHKPERKYLLEWQIQTDDGSVLVGMLNKTGRSISLDGDLKPVADFAVWFQQLSEENTVLFFDDQGSFPFFLSGLTLEQAIGKVKRAEKQE